LRTAFPSGDGQDCRSNPYKNPLPLGTLDAIALAHYAIVFARAWAADSINARVRLAAENGRHPEAYALLREPLAQIAPQRRPQYGPQERMAILELRAARDWSLKQTADTFFLNPATIASWVNRNIQEQSYISIGLVVSRMCHR